MEDVVVNVMFGLSVFLAFPVAVIGVIKHSCKLLVAASVLSLPFSLYVSVGYSLIFKSSLFIPFAFLLSCYFNKRDKRVAAWILISVALVEFLFIFSILKFSVPLE